MEVSSADSHSQWLSAETWIIEGNLAAGSLRVGMQKYLVEEEENPSDGSRSYVLQRGI